MLAPLVASLVTPVTSSIVKGISGREVRSARRAYINKTFFNLLNPLNNIEITNYFNDKPIFNGVFSRNNLPRIKNGRYVINLDDKNSNAAHWVSLFDRNTAVYFDSFGIEYIPQEVFNIIKDKLITLNKFRIPDKKSIMSGFYCIAFIEYMLAGKA